VGNLGEALGLTLPGGKEKVPAGVRSWGDSFDGEVAVSVSLPLRIRLSEIDLLRFLPEEGVLGVVGDSWVKGGSARGDRSERGMLRERERANSALISGGANSPSVQERSLASEGDCWGPHRMLGSSNGRAMVGWLQQK
jgi:hypothetical protein